MLEAIKEVHPVRRTHPEDPQLYLVYEFEDGIWVDVYTEPKEPHQKYWNKDPEFCVEGCKLESKHIGCCFR